MKNRPLTAKIILTETQCGFVKVKHSLPQSCYSDRSFTFLFLECLKVVRQDILSMQTRKRVNDPRTKQSCEVRLTRPADASADISVLMNFDTPNRINKPTTFQACKYTLYYAFQARLEQYIKP